MPVTIEPPPGVARLAFFTPVREYPPLADRKASALLAAYGLMVTVLLTFSKSIESILTGKNAFASTLMLAVLVPLCLLILLGAWYAFHALTRPVPPMPDSLAYYPQIAALPFTTYRDRVKDLDYRESVAAMLHYNYSLAILSVSKFRLVDRSMITARSTFELWLVLLLIIMLFQ